MTTHAAISFKHKHRTRLEPQNERFSKRPKHLSGHVLWPGEWWTPALCCQKQSKSADPLRSSGEAWCVMIALSFVFVFFSSAEFWQRCCATPPPSPPLLPLVISGFFFWFISFSFPMVISGFFFWFISFSFPTSSHGRFSLALVRGATSPNVSASRPA